jgi:hypothetical protein
VQGLGGAAEQDKDKPHSELLAGSSDRWILEQ